jgi:hypothetical protein
VTSANTTDIVGDLEHICYRAGIEELILQTGRELKEKIEKEHK